MSGFGVKTPLWREIVTNDFFFNTAAELTSWLIKTFGDDESRYYKLILEEVIQEHRDKRGDGIKMDGCSKSRMLSFFPDKKVLMRRHLCNCDKCSWGKFDKCEQVNIDSDLDEELLMLDDTDNLASENFKFITENSYVAVYSSLNSFELFYIIKVVNKCIADVDKSDIYELSQKERIRSGGG